MRFYHLIKVTILALLRKRTIGARVLLIKDDQVLLVKHTYQPGWYTIGGEVDLNETPRVAIERELLEEVGVTLSKPPILFAVYYSYYEKHDNYVIFYIAQEHTQTSVHSSEILESRWFPMEQLPDDTTPATRRRIEEYLGKRTITEQW